jgi:hypothetical protein
VSRLEQLANEEREVAQKAFMASVEALAESMAEGQKGPGGEKKTLDRAAKHEVREREREREKENVNDCAAGVTSVMLCLCRMRSRSTSCARITYTVCNHQFAECMHACCCCMCTFQVRQSEQNICVCTVYIHVYVPMIMINLLKCPKHAYCNRINMR